jgi:ribose transport system permease protein
LKTIKQLFPLIIAMACLLILFRIWVPNLLTTENMLDLTQQISVNAILAFGMTLTILIGGIDLSVGAIVALVGTTAVYILSLPIAPASSPLWAFPAIACALLVAVVFGCFNGFCASKTKMPPFIITLATMLVARGAALRFNEGRPMPIPDSQSLFLAIGNGRLFGFFPVPVLIMLCVFIVMAILLHKTMFGQHLYGIGGSAEAARLSGIPLFRRQIMVYVICSLLAGVAGMIHTSQLYSAEPASGVNFELNAIAAVVVGGTSFTGGIGTMPGTLIGAIIIGILDKGLNQAGVHFSLQYMVKGLVILGAVYMDVRRRK